MAIDWLLPVRGAQFVFAIIVLGISGHLAYVFANDFYYDFSVSQINFNVFTAVFSLLTLIYLILILLAMRDSIVAHPIAPLVVDGLNWIFWLAAFACIAAIFNGTPASGDFGALIAFGVLEWLLFSATFGWAIYQFVRGRGKSSAPPASTV